MGLKLDAMSINFPARQVLASNKVIDRYMLPRDGAERKCRKIFNY